MTYFTVHIQHILYSYAEYFIVFMLYRWKHTKLLIQLKVPVNKIRRNAPKISPFTMLFQWIFFVNYTKSWLLKKKISISHTSYGCYFLFLFKFWECIQVSCLQGGKNAVNRERSVIMDHSLSNFVPLLWLRHIHRTIHLQASLQHGVLAASVWEIEGLIALLVRFTSFHSQRLL